MALTVAVVVPTHDRAELLDRTLESLLLLDPAPQEIVVVADGCSDHTPEVVARHGVRMLETPGEGAASARNAGIRATTSDVVAFIDDDCVAEPAWVGALLEGFADDRTGLVQGRTLPAGPTGPTDRSIHVVAERGLYESCNIAYRREALDRVGGFDPRFGQLTVSRRGPAGGGRPFGEDTDLAWRVKRLGWRSRFASSAVVRHHVFEGTYLETALEQWRLRMFPFLVREIPELRDLMPGGRYLLRRHSALAQLFTSAVAAAALARDPRPLLAGAPYLLWLGRQERRPTPFLHRMVLDVVGSVALAAGSVRERTVVL